MAVATESAGTQNRSFSNAPSSRPRMGKPRNRAVEERSVWRPVTNLGRLVKTGCITSLEEIFLHSFAIKEVQIVDHFYARSRNGPAPSLPVPDDDRPQLFDEVLGVSPVQKQSSSGQRTRFRALVIVGDMAGHVGFGAKCDKEVANAIRGAIILAKLRIFPVRRGYWGNMIGKPHTVPMKVTGKCASVQCRLVPAPRGTGIVGSPISKKILSFAGVQDCFINTTGHTKTTGNYATATVEALRKTYQILTPDLWKIRGPLVSPLDVYAEALDLAQKYKEKSVQA